MPDALARALIMLSRRSDLVIAILVLVAVVMMIVPLPTVVVDTLITLNIVASVLILLVSFYIVRPIEFSSLPSVILIATLFRLAITITTTRLILLDADAGDVISAFGSFVIGGNIAVGLVIFLIITISQFVVITKGGERVAEVAARFSLDALPGKQMSIDSDLRNGDIDQATARRLRKTLERESHLYGAMDGAMKFVKGDAIAGLVIILVNLIGGLAVGSWQHGMTLSQAVATFSLLTVGDGLVAQIPALLISVAAGTVVTRVASEERRDLGAEITGQLLNNARALALAAAIILGLGFIPGFPMPIFFTLAVACAGGGYLAHRRALAASEERAEEVRTLVSKPRDADGEVLGALEKPKPRYRVTVGIGPELARVVPQSGFRKAVERVREEIYSDLGVGAPLVDLRIDAAADPHRFHIELEGVPVAEGEIPAGSLLLDDDPVHLELLAIPYQEGAQLIGRRPAIWVDGEHRAALTEAGIGFAPPLEALAKCLAQMLQRYTTHFVGIQETRELLAQLENDYAELVKEVQKVAPLQKIAEILRRLVEEDVPIRNLRQILEALIEWGQREQDVVLLVEYVRMALGRQICFRCADQNRVIAAYVIERSIEDLLRSSVRPTAVGTFLTVSDDVARPIVEQISTMLADTAVEAQPVVLASMDVRRHVRNLLTRNDIDLPVLSYQELAPEFSVQPLATIVRQAGGKRTQPGGGAIAQTPPASKV